MSLFPFSRLLVGAAPCRCNRRSPGVQSARFSSFPPVASQNPKVPPRPVLQLTKTHRAAPSSWKQGKRPIGTPRKIYILGTGNIGKLVAHSLRGIPNPPPVTLLLHRRPLYDEWVQGLGEINIITGDQQVSRTGFNAEIARAFQFNERSGEFGKGADGGGDGGYVAEHYIPSDKVIHNLIVTVPANATVSALDMVSNRLASDATILLLQNGMGTMEKVNESLFRDPNLRPNYLLGITTHGVTGVNNWTAIHRGLGTTMVGLPYTRLNGQPEEGFTGDKDPSSLALDSLPSTTRYLMQVLTRCPTLAAVTASPSELFLAQIEKLAVNCIINPLTVLLDAPNKCLLGNFHLTRVMRLLLAEISTVIRALPELSGLPDVEARFSAERLETTVLLVAKQTGLTFSSMLQAVRRGIPTEVEYMNGYIVKRGEELGIKCVMNYMIMHLVRGKGALVQKEGNAAVPFVRQDI